MSLILQFKDVKRDDLITLGERLFLFCDLVNNKIQTPNSFIITNEVLTKFLDETGLNNQIKELIDSTSITKDSLNILSSKIHDLILVVQKMTNPDKSILLEVTDNEIKINACFGTSEPLKNNEIEGDLYTLDKNNLQIKEYKINKQEFMLFRDENLLRTVRRNLYMRGEEQKLNYNEIEKIIEICYKLKELVQPNNKLEFVF